MRERAFAKQELERERLLRATAGPEGPSLFARLKARLRG
jgi:hypothetical protein